MVEQFKMSQLKSDACVFKNSSDSMFILSYVDDLLIIWRRVRGQCVLDSFGEGIQPQAYHSSHQWYLDSFPR
eukprot:6406641-Amphidinium_carterae.1